MRVGIPGYAYSGQQWATEAETSWRSATCPKSVELASIFDIRGLTCQQSLKLVQHQSSMMILWIFVTYFTVQCLEELPEHSQSSTKLSPYLKQRKPLKNLCSPHDIVSEGCVVHFQCRYPESEAKLNANALLFRSATRKLWFKRNTHSSKYLFKSNQRVKPTRLTRPGPLNM
jgi:hypothetical protein